MPLSPCLFLLSLLLLSTSMHSVCKDSEHKRHSTTIHSPANHTSFPSSPPTSHGSSQALSGRSSRIACPAPAETVGEKGERHDPNEKRYERHCRHARHGRKQEGNNTTLKYSAPISKCKRARQKTNRNAAGTPKSGKRATGSGNGCRAVKKYHKEASLTSLASLVP